MSNESIDARKELAQYILQKVKLKDLSPRVAARFFKELDSTAVAKKDNTDGYFAIIGISCLFPDAVGKDQLWDNIALGKNSIKNLPDCRRENFGLSDSEGYEATEQAGFLDCIDSFDNEYYNISPNTALQMDPYHRLMLQVFIETIEDAGYHDGDLQGKKIGVFVGNDHTQRYIASYLSNRKEIDAGILTGSWTGILASRLSYHLNLTGPALVIDSSCSSALVAIDTAIKSIMCGDCEAALIGGINLFVNSNGFNIEVYSSENKVRAFDNRADGTVFSEGVAGILIKPLSEAVKANDNIQGVIRGIAVNNDGKSNGLTAPNPKAQEEVIRRAWEKAAVRPDSLSYIEAHGTGTGLGDPIEVRGLIQAFAKFTNKRQFCAIGSIKTNIGHTVGVSGLASLIKVVMAMKEKAIPPSINFDIPNMFIDFCGSPVYIQDRLTEWPSNGEARMAGLNSFSYSGTNVHMVLEEAPSDNRDLSEPAWNLFTISGRTLELLDESVLRYIKYLYSHSDLRFEDICFTAAVGRKHYDCRAAILCRDLSGLLDGLECLRDKIHGVKNQTDLQNKIVDKNEEFISILGRIKNSIDQENNLRNECSNLITLLALADNHEDINNWLQLGNYYVDGLEVNFNDLYKTKRVKRCSLPPQPFKRNRFWQLAKVDTEPMKYQPDNTPEELIDLEIKETDASGNEIERAAAWAWSEVLGYPTINHSDKFFELGGDSLNGYKIINTINKMLNLDISISTLLLAVDFNDFVNEIKIISKGEEASEEISPEPQQQKDEDNKAKMITLPLAPPQARLYYTTLLANDSLAYNVTQIIKLDRSETYQHIQQILQILVERHESFRTSFHLANDTVVQVIHPEVALNVEYKKLEDIKHSSINELIDTEVEKFRCPFDLSEAPLLRALYLEMEGNNSILIMDMHHIIIDGTSVEILIHEFETLSEGQKLAPLKYKYSEAVSFLTNRINAFKMKEQEEWWIDQYSDHIPVLNLPTDKSRQASLKHEGSRIYHTLPISLYNHIADISIKSNATMFMVLLAALHVLLTKLCDTRETVIGTAVSGHTSDELENVIGMFVNTLPLKLQSQDIESFREFLDKTRTYVLTAYNNQNYPYEELINKLDIDRESGRNPLFDVFFVLQNREQKVGDKDEEIITLYPGGSKFELTISATPCQDGLKLEWEYAEDLFNRETIERLARQYEVLLNSIVDFPDEKLGNLSIMEDKEKDLLLNHWNHIETVPLDHRSIPSIFEEWVEKHSEKTALIMGNNSMSYGELNRRSNKIANEIIHQGISSGSAIALMFSRGFDMIASIMGVLKAGCHYLPLDLDLPKERLEHMLLDADVRLIITHNNLISFDLGGIKHVDTDKLDDTIPDSKLCIEIDGNAPAYIMYTSGSSGRPKGTLTCHKSIIRVVKDADYITIHPEDVLLQLSNYSFDGSTFDIFGALLNGASLVLIKKEEVIDLALLGQTIKENHVTVFFVTTLLFNALVDTSLECLKKVRLILFGGEAASINHVNKAYEYLGPGRICNVYGPTETTVFATCYPINQVIDFGSVPIGKAIGNTSIYVFDDKMRLQPIGLAGELYIGGAGVALKYLNQPQLTAEKFVDNPFHIGERLYRTGDMVAWGKDGYLRFLGRKDNQIKLRGFRIELTEIEEKARNYPLISEACASIYVDENNIRSLSIWVVLRKPEQFFDQKEFKDFLSQSLPHYMIPSFIIPVVQLPMNKNGKVDKAKLPPPAIEIINTDSQQPRNEKEQLLADIWKQVLGIKELGIDDNFFSIGGDSIKAIQIISRIRASGYQIDMDQLFRHQTIASLAKDITRELTMSIEQSEMKGDCKPSAIQAWFLNSTNATNYFNHMMHIKHHVKYDHLRMKIALDKLLQHHDLLRLTVNNDQSMSIRGYQEGPMYYLELLTETFNPDQLEEKLIDVQQRINLKDGPLVAAVVLEGIDFYEIYLAIHHMVIDVVSWNIILEDLFTLLDNPEKALPLKTVSFSAWTEALHQWTLNGIGAKDELPYWRSIAKKAQDLPLVFPVNNAMLKDTVTLKYWLEEEVGSVLCNEANNAYHTETMHLVLATLTRTLGKWLDTACLLINLEGHGRERFDADLDISRTIGWFTSSYPVLLQGSGDLGQVIIDIKETVRGVPRKGFGYGILRYLTDDLSAEDKDMLTFIQPEINFNYLGLLNDISDDWINEIYLLPGEVAIEPDYINNWALEIVGSQVGKRICLELRCPKQLLASLDFTALGRLLNSTAAEIVEYCCSKSSERTASDYTVSSIQQQELEDIFDDLCIG